MEDMGGSRIHDRVDCDVDFEEPAELWMNDTMSKLACVDSEGTFQSNLVEDMVAYASGATIEVEETEAVVAENVGTTAYQAMELLRFSFISPTNG